MLRIQWRLNFRNSAFIDQFLQIINTTKMHLHKLPPIPTPQTSAYIQKIISETYKKTEQKLQLNWYDLGWQHVLLHKDWSQLRILMLYKCEIDDVNIILLAKLNWPHLTALQLGTNRISDKGINNLLSNTYPKLQQLDLCWNNIGGEGMERLLNTQDLPRLVSLDVGGNRVNWRGLASMPEAKINQLKELWLYKNNIGSNGIKLLVKASLPELTKLALSNSSHNSYNCGLGDQGAKQLIKGNWPKLILLNIGGNFIEYEGLLTVSRTNWRNLQNIFLAVDIKQNVEPVMILGLFNSGCSGKLKIRFNCLFNAFWNFISGILRDRFPGQ